MRNRLSTGVLLLVLISVMFTGCGGLTPLEREHNEIKTLLQDGEFEQVYKRLNSERTQSLYNVQDSALKYLDLASAAFYAGRFAESAKFFKQSREISETVIKSGLDSSPAAFFLNDNFNFYHSPVYENIQADKLRIVSLLSGGKYDETLSALDAHYRIAENYKKWYGDLVSAVEDSLKIEERPAQTASESDSTGSGELKLLDFIKSFAREGAANKFREKPVKTDIEKNDSSIVIPAEPATLAFFAWTGMIPEKKETGARITSYDGYIIISGPSVRRTIILPSPFFTSGYNIKFVFPALEEKKSRVRRAEIYADGEKAGTLENTFDFTDAAINGFESEKAYVYMKTALRAFIKAVGTGFVSDKISEAGGFFPGRILSLLLNLIADQSESADVRGGELLPGKLYYSSLLFEPGVYDLEIRYFNEDGDLMVSQSFYGVEIKAGESRVINSYCLR